MASRSLATSLSVSAWRAAERVGCQRLRATAALAAAAKVALPLPTVCLGLSEGTAAAPVAVLLLALPEAASGALDVAVSRPSPQPPVRSIDSLPPPISELSMNGRCRHPPRP
jgi:hypothetical protein